MKLKKGVIYLFTDPTDKRYTNILVEGVNKTYFKFLNPTKYMQIMHGITLKTQWYVEKQDKFIPVTKLVKLFYCHKGK